MGLRRRSLRAAVSLVFLAALTIGVVSLGPFAERADDDDDDHDESSGIR